MTDERTCPECGEDLTGYGDPVEGNFVFYEHLFGNPGFDGHIEAPCCGESIYVDVSIRTVRET